MEDEDAMENEELEMGDEGSDVSFDDSKGFDVM